MNLIDPSKNSWSRRGCAPFSAALKDGLFERFGITPSELHVSFFHLALWVTLSKRAADTAADTLLENPYLQYFCGFPQFQQALGSEWKAFPRFFLELQKKPLWNRKHLTTLMNLSEPGITQDPAEPIRLREIVSPRHYLVLARELLDIATLESLCPPSTDLSRVLLEIAVALLGYGLVASLLIASIGSPFSNKRSWLTYCEQFFWDEPARFSGGKRIAEMDLIHQIFGSAQSIGQALIANPTGFFGHAWLNLTRFSVDFPSHLAEHFPLTTATPASFMQVSHTEFLILLAVLTSGIVAYFLIRQRAGTRASSPRLDHPFLYRVMCFLVFACLIRATIDVAIFGPSKRYYLELFFMAQLILWATLDRISGEKKHWAFIGIPLALVLACPDHRDNRLYPAVQQDWIPQSDPVKKVNLFLRGVPSSPEKQWFCIGSYSYFILDSRTCTSVLDFFAERAHYRDLADFLTQKNCGLIVIDDQTVSVIQKLGEKDDMNSLHRFMEKEKMKPAFEVPGSAVVWMKSEAKDPVRAR